MKPNYEVIDVNTGEIVSGITVVTHEQKEQRRKYYELRKERTYLDKDKKFILYLHKNESLFHKLSPRTAVRLIYLSTFLDFKNDAVLNVDLGQTLNLGRKGLKRFIDETTSAGLLKIREDGKVELDKETFVIGPLGNLKYQLIQKIYTKTVRQLYECTPESKLQYLGYVFLLIPYINTEWNIVAHNPHESLIENVQPMTLGEFCEAIGYDKHNSSRIIKNFFNITFPSCGKQQRFCSFVYDTDTANMQIFINPNIFYAGRDKGRVEVFGRFF